MTTPKPTPASPDSEKTLPNSGDNTSPPERDGFFRRVRRGLNPEPIHPSEAEEIVIMPDEEGQDVK
jgi:hypothetical protein